jgi:predicted secreted protein
MTWFTSALLVVLMLGGTARAEPSEAERAARWADLKHAIFGDRVVEDAGDRVAIDAPMRAEDAALVPVAIRVVQTFALEVRGLYLVIDNNLSPMTTPIFMLLPKPRTGASTRPRGSSRRPGAARRLPARTKPLPSNGSAR